MSSACHSYVLVCYPYVTRMYSYVTCMKLICTRMSCVYHEPCIMLPSKLENLSRCCIKLIHVCKKLPLALDCSQSKYSQ